jgi:hypothetical protein
VVSSGATPNRHIESVCFIRIVSLVKKIAMTDSQLYAQIASLPADLKKEVSDFVAFLKQRASLSPERKGPESTPKFGSLKGKIYISPDFNEPLDDFKDYM